MRLEILVREGDRDATELLDVAATLREVATELRCSIAGERPAIFGGADAEQVATRIERSVRVLTAPTRTHLDFRCAVGAGVLEARPDLAHDLECVVREAVSNAVRHGGASLVTVVLAEDRAGEGAARLALTVTDNGSGPEAQPGRTGGLENMRVRARLHGGRCDLVGAPGGGSALEWNVPIDGRA